MKLDDRPLATVRNGDLLGVRDGPLEVWRAVPYAQPPVGELRFRAPQPAPAWDGVRDAGRGSPAAIQPALIPGLRSSEDCLYLTVSAPTQRSAPLPVVVWLHGGGYRIGAGEEAVDFGRSLVGTGEIVLVSPNHRLGVLGFLHLGEHAPDAANCGLLDQLAALEWVQHNIAAFGGDPDRITVLGASAGAKAVGTLLAVPRAVAVVRRAISMSGGADFTNDLDEARELSDRFCRALGLDTPDVAALRARPAAAILAAQETLASGVASTWTWRPTVDGRLLADDPLRAIAGGSARGVDLLGGTVTNEARLFTTRFPGCAASYPTVAARVFGARAADVLDAYPEADGGAERFLTAERYLVPTTRLLEAQQHHAPVWAYRFGAAEPGALPAGHSSDVALLWSTPRGEEGPAALARGMQQAWVGFARDGVPAADGLPLWPRYEPGARHTMLLDVPATVASDPGRDERLLWAGVTWRPGNWAG